MVIDGWFNEKLAMVPVSEAVHHSEVMFEYISIGP
jgi:hypothetical protein